MYALNLVNYQLIRNRVNSFK